MTKRSKPGRKVSTAETLFEIIEVLHEQGTARVADVTDATDLSRSTVYDYLATLEPLGYVIHEGDLYRLGPRFLDHGIKARSQYEFIRHVYPTMEYLASETGEAVWLTVEENGLAVYLRKADQENATQTFGRIGKHTHMHCIATGKAILAHLPKDRVEAVIDRRGLPAKTDRTITDKDELLAELETVRDRGVAVNDNEAMSGLRAVAAPIVHDETVLGAIGLSAYRMDKTRFEERIPELLTGALNEIEVKISHAESERS